MMTLQDTLLAFSEWLEDEGLLPDTDADGRTHEDFGNQFIEHWESNPDRAILLGRPPRGPAGPALPEEPQS